MDSIEKISEPKTIAFGEAIPDSLEAGIERIDQSSGHHELVVFGRALGTREAVLRSGSETAAALSARVAERTRQTLKELERIRSVATLALTLLASSVPETAQAAPQEMPASARLLMERPELAETLLKGVQITMEKLEESGPTPELQLVHEETEAVLQEVRPKDRKYLKLTGRIAERVTKVVADMAGFGAAFASFEILKDVVQTVRGKTA